MRFTLELIALIWYDYSMKEELKDNSSLHKVNYDFYQTQWENAGRYLDKSAGAKWYNYLIQKSLKHIDENKVSNILDVGCGVGNKTFYLAKKFPGSKVTGSDFSETGILEARKYFTSNNLRYVVGEASDKSKIKRADLVTFFEVLEHVDDWKKVLDSTIKTTKAQYILIGSPTGKRYEGGIHMGHVLHFKKGEIEGYLRKKGYKQVNVMYAGFPFVSPVFRDLSQAMQKQYAEFVKAKPSRFHSLINAIWYVLFRHLSTTKAGNQFMGLFEKE